MMILLAQNTTIDMGTALASIGVVVAALAGAIGLLFRLLIQGKDREIFARQAEFNQMIKLREVEFTAMESLKQRLIDELTSSIKSYQELARESIDSARQMADALRHRDGKDAVPILLPVIPESHSPATQIQETAADIATMRATLAAVKLAMNQDPREPHKDDDPGAL